MLYSRGNFLPMLPVITTKQAGCRFKWRSENVVSLSRGEGFFLENVFPDIPGSIILLLTSTAAIKI
jgi:hypothetical protein